MFTLFSTNAGLLLAEVMFYGLAIIAASLAPRGMARRFSQLKVQFCALSRRRTASILIVMATVLVVRGLLLSILPPPVPGVHDEYSYLLAGETFASGRLANPPHPLWQDLETFYVIQEPTYASMYPPAQGIALAAGYFLGHPWLGVYLSVALMCGGICWMLQGWLPPQWALIGALITVARLGIYSYWMESYWGGAVAALGGALAAGALPRMAKSRSAAPAVIMGVGLLMLANSRPFEGAVFGISVLAWLAVRMARLKHRDVLLPWRPAAALGIVLVLGIASMLYYFQRVTGSPLRMPYQVHSKTYEVTGPFIWQSLRKTPVYRHVVMEKYHVGRQTAAYIQAHTLRGWIAETWRKAESIAVFYFWPAVLPTLFALPFLLKNSRVQFTLFTGVLMFAGLVLEIWPMTLHYHAPLAGPMALLLVQVMRFWRLFEWRGRRVGAGIAAAIPLFCTGLLAFRLTAAILHVPVPAHGLVPWFTVVSGNVDRVKIQRFLEEQPGPQLVLVQYDTSHHVDEEWVHNSADIDASKVVWARYSSEEENLRIVSYFQNRRAWLVAADAKPPRITPIPQHFSGLHLQ